MRVRVGYTYYPGHGHCIVAYMPQADIDDVKKAASIAHNVLGKNAIENPHLQVPMIPYSRETILCYLDANLLDKGEIRGVLESVQEGLVKGGFERFL